MEAKVLLVGILLTVFLTIWGNAQPVGTNNKVVPNNKVVTKPLNTDKDDAVGSSKASATGNVGTVTITTNSSSSSMKSSSTTTTNGSSSSSSSSSSTITATVGHDKTNPITIEGKSESSSRAVRSDGSVESENSSHSISM